MGVDCNFVCKDCKIKAYLGYGSYRGENLVNSGMTLKEFDAAPEEDKIREKNRNFRKMLENHEGHDFMVFSTEYLVNKGNDLWYEDPFDASGNDLFLADYKNYKEVDLGAE